MGAPRPARGPLRPPLVLLACGSALLGGCETLSTDRDANTDEARARSAEPSAASPEPARARASAPEAKPSDPPPNAAQRAAQGAPEPSAPEPNDPEPNDPEPSTPEPGGPRHADAPPIELSALSVRRTGGSFGASNMIELTAKARLNQALGSSTYVHVKSRCKKDDKLIADVGYLNASYTKPLEQYATGEQADIKGTLYTQGLQAPLSPCQFEFRVGGIGGGLSVAVGEACWTGAAVATGRCEPALAPVATSGAAVPVEVHDLRITRGGGPGSAKGLVLDYLLLIHESQDNNARLTFKSACRMGDKAFVDMGQANLIAGPFEYEAGEAVARSANLYWSSAFALADPPDDCDLTTSLWKTKEGTFGEYEEIRVKDSCWRDGTLRDGRCDPAAPPPVAVAPLGAESVVVDGVRLELVEPPGASATFQLKIQADITVRIPVNQNDGATAKVSCRAGKDNRVESAYLFGPELYYLRAGETGRMTANAFGSHPLPLKPKSCKVEFFGGPRFSPSGTDGVDLGKFCLKRDKVTKGGRC